ncbi:MAG: c-type cytochrome [Gammaproteobacteria bacterium]|nr:c-type cytochrome [Gammaproteobacteria bacterium]
MKKSLLSVLALFLCFPLLTQAADLANGERINKNCALCHGIFGQGANGRLSPRLAGMPEYYLHKSIKDYISGKRINPTMMETSGLAQMAQKDIDDVVAYLSSLDIAKDQRFNILQRMPGNPQEGEDLYDDDCKTCHGKDGFGKKKKESPPLAGQHPEYLFQSVQMFKGKVREHADDPDDETFDDYSDTEVLDMIAYATTLDDVKVVTGAHFTPPRLMAARPPMPLPSARPVPVRPAAPKGGLRITDITQTVAQMELKPGVSREDAVQAMMSKAVELNLRLVGSQEVSKELESRGVETPFLAIYQFCNPMDARTMIINNPIFASYMPCRISLVEDPNGKLWLMMLNLDMLINSQLLPQEVVDTAIKVNQQMLDIMVAGATGEF